jgi:hypothetical protein
VNIEAALDQRLDHGAVRSSSHPAILPIARWRRNASA